MLELNNDDTGKAKADLSAYSPFGDYAQTANEQGWYPQSSWFNNGTVYASNYNKAFNDVIIPNQLNMKGNVALIGYPNKTFDIVIRDKDGNIQHTINKGVSAGFVQDYITKAGGLVDTRKDYVAQNTPAINTNQLPIGDSIFQ